jgi:hypothetical protein
MKPQTGQPGHALVPAERQPCTGIALPEDDSARALELLHGANKMLAEVSSMSDAWAALEKAKEVHGIVEALKVGRQTANEATAIVYRAKQLFLEYVERGQAACTIAKRGQNDGRFSRYVPVTTPAYFGY